MRTETYNALRQYALDECALLNSNLSVWASDPVGIGTTLTQRYATANSEMYEFVKQHCNSIRIHTDIIAKLDELHGV